jgi:hypothetical protein
MAFLLLLAAVLVSIVSSSISTEIDVTGQSESIDTRDVSVIIAALGGENEDGDREDPTWIPRNFTGQIFLYHYHKNVQKKLYHRARNTKFIQILTGNRKPCLTYLRHITNNYDSLSE